MKERITSTRDNKLDSVSIRLREGDSAGKRDLKQRKGVGGYGVNKGRKVMGQYLSQWEKE